VIDWRILKVSDMEKVSAVDTTYVWTMECFVAQFSHQKMSVIDQRPPTITNNCAQASGKDNNQKVNEKPKYDYVRNAR